MIGHISRIAAVTLISGFLLSCTIASSQKRTDTPQSAVIQDVRITEGNGKTIIEIEGEELMIYTTFQLTDPNRLIIDIAGIELGVFDQEIQLEGGPIRSLRPISGGGSNVTRLELVLEETVEARVSNDELNLIIEADDAGRMKSKFVFFGEGDEQAFVETKPEKIVEGDSAAPENTEIAVGPPAFEPDEPALEEVLDLRLEQIPLEVIEQEKVIEVEKPIETLETVLRTDLVSSASAIEEGHEISSEPLEATGQENLVPLEEFSGVIVPPLPMSAPVEIEDTELGPSVEKVSEETPAPFVEDASDFLEDPFGGALEDPFKDPELEDMAEEMEEVSAVLEPSVEMRLTQAPALEKEVLFEKLPSEEKPLPIAKWLKSIQFVKGEALGMVITLDGTLRPRIFRVDKKRIAIDLPGVKTKLKITKILAEDLRVKQVRIGVHATKLRLVVDLASPATYTWKQTQQNVELTFRDPAATVPSNPEKQVESPEAVAVLPVNQAPAIPSFEDNEIEDDIVRDPSDLKDLSGLRNPSGLLETAEPMKVIAPEPSVSPGSSLPTFEDEKIEDDVLRDTSTPMRDSLAPTNEVAQTKVEAEVEAEVDAPVPEISPVSSSLLEDTDIEDAALTTLPPPLVVDKGKTLADPLDKHLEASKVAAPVEAEDASLPAKPLVKPLNTPTVNAEGNASPEVVDAAEKKTGDERKKHLRKKTFLRRHQGEITKQAKDLFVQRKKAGEIHLESSLPEYTGKKVSLDFQDAEVSNVIRLIADVSHLNFVMGEDVKGKVSLKLSNVPWDQALEIILEMNSLGKVQKGNIIRITTLSNLANQRDEIARAKETEVNSADLFTRVIYVNYGKADEVQKLLEKLLSPRGELMVDKRTNAIIVKDIEESLEQIERLASKLDTKTPQVLIEARVAEVKPFFKKSLGVQWGADFKTTRGGNIIGIGTADSSSSSVVNAPIPQFAVNLPANNNLGGVGFSFGRFSQSPFSLDLRLSAGEVQGMTRIVSTPKIMVLDNHEAIIEQGESIPFQTTSGNDGTKTEFIDANLTLKVRPHISPDGGILLDILLTKNEPALTIEDKAPGPRIFKKEISTKILLMDGETMVIGGIYETQKSKTESGIPFLKDLPLIGWLFKNKEVAEETSELLIFITPTIMD